MFHYNPVELESEDDRRFFGNITTYVEYDIIESIAHTFMRVPQQIIDVQYMFPRVDPPSYSESIAAYYFVTLMSQGSQFIMTGRNTFIPVVLNTVNGVVYRGGNPVISAFSPMKQTIEFISAAKDYVRHTQDVNRRNRTFDVKGRVLIRLYERILNLIIDRPRNLITSIIVSNATTDIAKFARYPDDYFRYDGQRVDEIIEVGRIEDRVLRLIQRGIERNPEKRNDYDTRDTESVAESAHVHTLNATIEVAVQKGMSIIEAVRRAGTAKTPTGTDELAMKEASYVMWTYTLSGLQSEVIALPNSSRVELLDLLID